MTKNLLRKTFIIIGWFFSALTFGSRLGSWAWPLDVLSHYHLQYIIGLTLALAILLLLKDIRPYLLVLLAALLVNLYLVAPFFLPVTTNAHAATPATPLRVMALNISTSNAGYGQVIELIRERHPDLVFLSEVRQDLVDRLQTDLAESYPYLHAVPSRMTLGIAFLSRRPFVDIQTVTMAGRGRRYLRAELEWEGTPVTVVGIHPLPPFNGQWAAERNNEIARMGELAQQTTHPFILLGDLNASPWSSAMQQLLARSDLRYAMQGYGVWPSWRLAGPLLGAPLDYILVSPQWQVVNYLEAGDIHSDHIPIQADLTLSASTGE
ncbi:MAG: endonuclease/exonuclease/phosphatase family protein [Caldilineaceae bacterium]